MIFIALRIMNLSVLNKALRNIKIATKRSYKGVSWSLYRIRKLSFEVFCHL